MATDSDEIQSGGSHFEIRLHGNVILFKLVLSYCSHKSSALIFFCTRHFCKRHDELFLVIFDYASALSTEDFRFKSAQRILGKKTRNILKNISS